MAIQIPVAPALLSKKKQLGKAADIMLLLMEAGYMWYLIANL